MKEKTYVILSRGIKYLRVFFLLLDIIALNLSLFISTCIRFGDCYYADENHHDLRTIVTLSNLIWILLIGVFDAYKIVRIEPMEKILGKSIKMVLSFGVLILIIVTVIEFAPASKSYSLYFVVVFMLMVVSLRLMFLKLIKVFRQKGYNNRQVVIIGATESAVSLKRTLEKDLSMGYRVMGFFTDFTDKKIEDCKRLGMVDDFYEYTKNNVVHEVYFTLTDYPSDKIFDLIVFCEQNFIRCKIIPNFARYTRNKHVTIDFYNDLPVLLLRKEPLDNLFNKFVKRLFDILFSLIIILLIVPWLFPIVMLIQKLTSKGPVFFLQKRSGQDNVVFNCWKFRTMMVNDKSDSMGTLDNDPRITPFGKFLRKSRIDELPQFFNVLIGQMSVVGPRPHMLAHTEEYSKLIREFLVRQYVKPGITGWAQTFGYIDESQKLKEMKDKVKNDIYYIENWSFLLDLKIILHTALKVFVGDKNAK
jgi:putative colanic acid biosysnthesis UDP-glucose lipid carrier transferase